ncbi:MAG: GFA family protein [Sneathiella sp.]
MITGSCLCGKVKFKISEKPSSLSYCHCSRCRKSAGIFSAVLIGKASVLPSVQGEEAIRKYIPEEPWVHSRCFCQYCGSSLGDMAPYGGIYVIAASALDDSPGIKPTVHLHTAAKPNWYDIQDDLEKFAAGVPTPDYQITN